MVAGLKPPLVYDNVFDARALGLCHDAAVAGGLGHACFAADAPRAPIEHALSSFLSELGDAEYGHVEYWARQEWKHIEAHADVDETAAAAGGALRYPTTGHVLYLRVGSEVRGPTCVWSDRALARGALTTVPAVAGRVLRFDGAATHAVPRPHDLWFLPFVKSGGRGDAFERSVVLFNTWPADAPPEGIGPSELAAPDDASALRCNARDAWREAPAREAADDAAPIHGKVWLLGDAARRGQAERTATLGFAPAVLDALAEPERVTTVAAPSGSEG